MNGEGKQQGEEIEQFLNKLGASPSFEDTKIIFADAIDLFQQALGCYKVDCHMAVALLCRSSLECALYRLAIAEDIEYIVDDLGKPIVQIKHSADYVKIARCYGQFQNKANRKFNISTLNKKIERVRELGNFAAHYSQRVYEQLDKGSKNQKRGLTNSKPVRLWIGRNEARRCLKNTVSVLISFQKAPYEKATEFRDRTSG